MTAETQTLNFGPEWLRALSSGGSVISPPLSPALPKYKLADYRYGREEMLALYVKDNKVPSDLLDKEFQPILKEEPLLPLALLPFTEEEQRNFSMSVNSTAVLRLMGRGTGGGGGTVVGAPRGRSSSRGRGRGRGEGFYQRSFDEVESGFGRGAREMHRSQSWEERGDRRFEKTARKEAVRPAFEEGIAAPAGRKHEFVRFESGNWRSLREELNGEEEDGGGVWRTAAPRREGERWRSHSPDGVRGPGWREHPDRRRRFEFDFRERDDERGYRRTRSGSGSAEDERDSLPEWCLEDAEDETGTFDSSGAFLPSKKVQKEPIPEEQELDFRASVEAEDHSDSNGGISEETKEDSGLPRVKTHEESRKGSFEDRQMGTPPEPEHRTPSPVTKINADADPSVQKKNDPPVSKNTEQEVRPQTPPKPPTPPNHKEDATSHGLRGSHKSTAPCIPQSTSPAFSQSTAARQVKDPHQGSTLHSQNSTSLQIDSISGSNHQSVTAAPGMGGILSEPDEEDGLEHLEQQAQQMVAYLQDGTLDDDRLTGKVTDLRVKGLSPDNQQKWYYKDPQGEIQGPFSNREMAEWYQAGYFPVTLLLRRVCDEAFQPLGDLIKLWGRVPFITPPPPRLGELGPEHIGHHQEMTTIYQIQQLHYQQFLIQQQYAQMMAQQQKAALSSQQQQQLALLLQQFQALKMRISEQTVIPTLTRAMSVPDNTPLWELQTAAPPSTMWEGSSVWELPVEPASQGASREQLEQMEKAKAAKIEQERREAELRAKQQQEEEERRQLEEEERKRKEELELARRKQEEALRRQREQEMALRRQLEEEERKREEERRLLEERRRQEEERRRQEEERRRLEEERKKAEDERRKKEEEKKREEEERRQREREELQRKQEEAARWAREEEEAARRLLEEARQRQEEEERKKREEAQRQKELQRQRQQQQEALRRLQQQQQQQQLAQIKLPSSSTWGQQVNSVGSSQSALSLAEIQKLEEERERQNQEEQLRRQQQELKSMQQQLQQQQQQQKVSGWGNVGKSSGNTKSLLEIQHEEARQMQQMQQQAVRSRPPNITLPTTPAPPQPQHTSSSSSSVWGSLNNNPSPQWSADSISSIWNSPESKSPSGGFWDDAVKVVAPRNTTNKNKNNASKSSGANSRQSKKVEQEEKLVRLFQGATKCPDSFIQWCEQTLHALSTAHNLDVRTFVSFLREVESPYEVHDYVCEYLGDTPEAKDFSKQFLERRNKQKTTTVQKPQQESGWGVYPTSQNNLQPAILETAQSAGRKKKKQKMVRADPSLLGFSVNASSERLNMGEIETPEDY